MFLASRPQKTMVAINQWIRGEISGLSLLAFFNFVAPEKPAPPVVGKVTPNSIELYWNQETTEDISGGRLRYCIQEEEEDTRKGFGNVYK